MRQKLVPEALSFAGTFDQPGDIDKLDDGRDDLLRFGQVLKHLDGDVSILGHERGPLRQAGWRGKYLAVQSRGNRRFGLQWIEGCCKHVPSQF